MHALKAKVVNGRFVIDEPAQLPDGAEMQLELADGYALPPQERAQLNAAIEEGLNDSDADRVISAEESLAELRALRWGLK